MDPNNPQQPNPQQAPPPGGVYLRTNDQPVAYDNYGNPLYQHPPQQAYPDRQSPFRPST